MNHLKRMLKNFKKIILANNCFESSLYQQPVAMMIVEKFSPETPSEMLKRNTI